MDTNLATAKLTELIERGQSAAPAALARIEQMRPTDTVIPMSALTFSDSLEAILGETHRALHDNAIRQASDRASIPQKYSSLLQTSAWGKKLLAENLREQFAHADDRVLLRSVNNELRAVLSDNYRRLDAFQIIDAFAEAVTTAGGVITEVQISDLRIGVKAIHPTILWIGNDPFVLGARLGESDFGKGAHAVSAYLTRLICLNGMTGESMARQVHLGKRIGDDSMFSDRTRDLDTQTMASATGDIVRAQFSPEAFGARREKIERAAATDIDPKETFRELGKVLTKVETEKATETFMFGTEEQVPAGRNAWRLSNAISWIAKSATNVERTIELERLAGALLDTPAAKASVLDSILSEYGKAA
jgi:hypothetical protein